MQEELHYKLLKVLEANPRLSQREMAKELGVSLGKTNYCLRALIEKGLVKAKNFRNNKNKLAYAYLLTPKGIEEKIQLTARFLAHKRDEYELICEEIKRLETELER